MHCTATANNSIQLQPERDRLPAGSLDQPTETLSGYVHSTAAKQHSALYNLHNFPIVTMKQPNCILFETIGQFFCMLCGHFKEANWNKVVYNTWRKLSVIIPICLNASCSAGAGTPISMQSGCCHI